MVKTKKDSKSLNVSITKDLFIQFDAFCKVNGMSKTGATEIALKEFMSKRGG